jgi:hypothetical protein
MKKKSFYSLHKIDGELKAVLHSGYTDDVYYYYNNGRNAWNAIHPETGLSIAFARTRKECQWLAYSDKAENAIIRAERTGCIERWRKDFLDCVENACMKALYEGVTQ